MIDQRAWSWITGNHLPFIRKQLERSKMESLKNVSLEERQIRDAMRGILWENQHRGTLEKSAEYNSLEFLKNRAKTWLNLPEPKVIKVNGWPKGFVGWGTYGWKYKEDTFKAAVENRAALIDTGESYGFGRVEKALGEFLKGMKAREIVGIRNPPVPWICSKVARNHMGSSSAVVNAARRSRDTLGRPIDLYQIHWPPPKRNYGIIMGAMKELLDEGTILRVGVSNFCVGQIYVAQTTAQNLGFNIESLQIRVNKEDPSALDYLIPVANALGLRVIAHSPFGQGKSWAENIRWVRDHVDAIRGTGVDYIIPGTNDPKHLVENLKIGM